MSAPKIAPAGASRRRAPVRRTMIEAAAKRQAAEIARRDDALPDPVAMHADERQAVRERVVQRLRAMAFRVVAQCGVAAAGGSVEGLTDALEELEVCSAETVGWLRAARGERGAQ